MGTTTPVQAHELVSDIEYSSTGIFFRSPRVLTHRILWNARRLDGDDFAGHCEEWQGRWMREGRDDVCRW